MPDNPDGLADVLVQMGITPDELRRLSDNPYDRPVRPISRDVYSVILWAIRHGDQETVLSLNEYALDILVAIDLARPGLIEDADALVEKRL